MIVVLLLAVGCRVLTAIVGSAVGGFCLLLFVGCRCRLLIVLSVAAVGSCFSGRCGVLAVD